MPKPKLTDLSLFQDWLIESYSISRRSASVYASRVRKILNELEAISASNLSRFAEENATSSSLDMFITSWNRFSSFIEEERNTQIPTMKRPKIAKIQKVSIQSSMLELAHYLKHVTSIPYTRMLTFAWADVRTSVENSWEIADPTEFGTFYKVPKELLQNVANNVFGDYPIDQAMPLFVGHVPTRRKISRSHLSKSLSEYVPTFKRTTQKKEAVEEIIELKGKSVVQPEDIMIGEVAEEPDLPDILNDYSMFDPDKF